MFNSYNELKKTLGEYDCLVELKELILLNFDRTINLDSNPVDCIRKISEKEKIFFNPNSYPEAKRLIKHSYISLAYSAFDDFLKILKDELTIEYDFRNSGNTKGLTEIDLVNQIIYENTRKEVLSEIGSLDYFIIEHYRKIRNEFIHPSIKKKEPINFILGTKYEIQCMDKYSKHLLLIDDKKSTIEFDDFILLSMAIKNYAYDICNLAEPNDEYYKKKSTRINI